MKPYISTSGKKSGITGYEIGDTFIKIQFGKIDYLYTYNSAGSSIIEMMKSLALNSEGLSTFVSQNKPQYEKKYN